MARPTPIKNSIRAKIVDQYHRTPFWGDERTWRSEFWSSFVRRLNKKERSYLNRVPEFIRECVHDSMVIPMNCATSIAKEFLLSRVRW